jgi:hypothetical protein
VQHAHAIADDLDRERLLVVARERLAREHGRRDAEHERAGVVGQPVEGDALLRVLAAQHDGAVGDGTPVARERDVDLPIGEPGLPDDRLDRHGRAHEREVVGQHGRDREIAQRPLADGDRAHGRAQGRQIGARHRVERPLADAPRVDPVGDDDDAAEVASCVARAQVTEGLADARGVPGGRRGERRRRRGRERLAERVQVDVVPVALPGPQRGRGALEQRVRSLGAGAAPVRRPHLHRARGVDDDGDVVRHVDHLALLDRRLERRREAGGHARRAQQEQQPAAPVPLLDERERGERHGERRDGHEQHDAQPSEVRARAQRDVPLVEGHAGERVHRGVRRVRRM